MSYQRSADRVEIRVGTSKPHMVVVWDKDEGEFKRLKIKAKPIFAPLGTAGIIPKDGGK